MAGITDIVGNGRYTDIVNQANEKKAQETEKKEDKSGLGKDSFLQLLVTSLQYQDPTSPMETSEMMNQISMLGLMESSTNMSKALEELTSLMDMSKWEQTSGMLGKEVSGTNGMGETVTGTVEEVVQYDGIMYVLTDENAFQLNQIVSMREPSRNVYTDNAE